MPVRRIKADDPSEHIDLIEQIANELRSADSGRELHGDGDAPEIIEEEIPRSPYIQVTVLWERWKELGLDTRGGIVLDAYKLARGEEAMRNISRVLGLTHDEAATLGPSVF